MSSPYGLLFSSLHELVQGHVVDLDDLVSHAGDVSVRPAHPASDTLNQNLVVFVNEVDGSITDGESGDLPAVLDQLNLDALSDCRVGLLCLDPDLLKDDTLGLRRALQRVGFLLQVERPALVIPVTPSVLLSLEFELSGGVQASWQIFTLLCEVRPRNE